MNVVTNAFSSVPAAKPTSLRTGEEYLRSLNDGRAVYLDGERVANVTTHPAFAGAARSCARLFDIAADPSMSERMTFESPSTGARVLRAYQNSAQSRRSPGKTFGLRDLGGGVIRHDGADP